MNRIFWVSILVLVLILMLATSDSLQSGNAGQTVITSREDSIQKLQRFLFDRGKLKRNRATGLVDFVRLNPRTSGSLIQTNAGTSTAEKSLAFLSEHRQEFGLLNPNQDLKLKNELCDLQGGAHLTFNQIYKGVRVFAAMLKAHFNSAGELRAVNGVIVPNIELNSVPSRTPEEAAAVALAKVQQDSPKASALKVQGSKLYIYRTGLAQGIPGDNHLVWEVEVTNSLDVREFVYIDAHSGKFVDQLKGIYDALDRRVYDGENIDQDPPPNFPSNPFWVEGQPFPTGVADADEVIVASKETYDLFKNGFGRDSFDDLGSTMQAIFNSGFSPGNAFASPIRHLTVFGNGLTADDIIGHEWTHIYTFYTGGLIYAWQPGALNEAYSDIFGETVDILNGRGLDVPGRLREANDCSFPVQAPMLHVNSPAFLQGDYSMAPATFGPPFSPAGLQGNIVIVDDGTGARTDGCQTPFKNAGEVSGKIALIDRSDFGTCFYEEKVKNAQLNGAVGVIIANDAAAGDNLAIMWAFDPSITIPSGRIGYSDGQALRSPRARTVNATITGGNTGNSHRWLIGEQTPFQGIRDMWNPRCYENPAKVTDKEYFCGTFDQGGVHENSGVPNHAYALLVDGGTYNGQTIQPIGLVKAAHIYFRAMSVYQTPTSDFGDHAEALEVSTSDLIGVNLPDLMTGLPSGQVITSSDAEQIHKATLAVELRNPPTQCGFEPVLDKDPPFDSCPAPDNLPATVFSDDFESDPTSRWVIGHEVGSSDTFTPRDWIWVEQLPGGRSGSGFFGPDPIDNCISPAPGEVGVLHLESPEITLPQIILGGAHLSFDHYVATEARYDGGQLMISVNGRPFQLVEAKAFIYNPYNTRLFPAVPGYEFLFNPRAGQPAFSGTDGGSLKGSWGTSIVDLTTYARSGDRIRLRWDLSTDYCFGTDSGWYLDHVRVYSCLPH